MAAKKTEKTQDDNKQVDPKAYTAGFDVYQGGVFAKAGEVFVTAADPMDGWVQKTPEQAHIIDASQNKVPADVPLDDLSEQALEALAVTKNVNPTGMDRQQLIDAIKAANEPAL